jgi:pre-rRNA-processing protein TSR3
MKNMVSIKIFIAPPYSIDNPVCTAVRMITANKAEIVDDIPLEGIILLPQARKELVISDFRYVNEKGLIAIDANWDLLSSIYEKIENKERCRKLPRMIAANPVHPNTEKITTAEAIIASLLILGLTVQARSILDMFEWKQTFIDNNLKNVKLRGL